MRQIIGFITIFFLVFTTQAQSPKKSFKNAKKLIQNSNFHEAIEELNASIEGNMNYTDAYVLRAELNEKLDRIELAARDFEKAAILDSKTVAYFYHAGRLNYLLQNYDLALRYLNEAALLDSKDFQVLQYKSLTHLKREEYKEAIVAIDNAMLLEKTYLCFYIRGVAFDSLQNVNQAISNYEKAINLNGEFQKVYFALIKTYLKSRQLENAYETANLAVKKFPNEAEAYEMRSLVNYSRGSFLNAINDLSKLETMVNNSADVLFRRGRYYFEIDQFQNAKSDFSQVIYKTPEKPEAFYWRGRANEEMMEFELASNDYQHFLNTHSFGNPKLTTEAKIRFFDLNRETEAPVILIDTPMVWEQNKLTIINNAAQIELRGKLNDQSDIDSFLVNGQSVPLTEVNTFSHVLNLSGIQSINLTATDVYGNTSSIDFELYQIETNKPKVNITNPYVSYSGELYLDSNEPFLFVEGFIEDESLIQDIYVDGVRATFDEFEQSPKFTCSVSILNKDKISIKVVDIYSNSEEQHFTLNREGTTVSESNPMGKTWVVFIENSTYENYADLNGPSNDFSAIKAGLSNYEIHNLIHKKNVTKEQMERFFNIELRDLVKQNNVNSLVIWYAGHGKLLNETGYWIPTDAKTDDEFSYYNINTLKAGVKSYISFITHFLVVTDACETGAAFYLAARSATKTRPCDDIQATQFKSAQVFSSVGHEQALDDSPFTKAFAKSLQVNKQACLSIEAIVTQVNEALLGSGAQKPTFGRIDGLDDENGTFFFVKKQVE